MLQALVRTITEILDSKKAAYSFIATALAAVLHLYFGVSPENALLLVSPLGVATAAQAHVDASRAKNGAGSNAAADAATRSSAGGSGGGGSGGGNATSPEGAPS